MRAHRLRFAGEATLGRLLPKKEPLSGVVTWRHLSLSLSLFRLRRSAACRLPEGQLARKAVITVCAAVHVHNSFREPRLRGDDVVVCLGCWDPLVIIGVKRVPTFWG